ncbi:biliverdin-producing heme oxygenase [Lentzea sp. HUAS12]|uniref:biliverdin-producing heme oxygenase n=1 Tax=Lentzea sp. HUAS12 TaxID=2951806 RepID=UPI0020A1CBFD|nr:biliverdin-producing heme oxygenase [Lentzea sp. HUAS12]USX54612.1 biliverdin-producing heme oxygenase [Lentzea sp. HUAS12]
MTLLTRLRTDTRAAHQALEDDLAFLSGLTPARYSEVLAAFLGFHEPLEKALTASAAAHRLPWDLAPDTDRLTSDLRGLGWSSSRIASLPRSSPPDVEALPALVGSLYVVEGARLGGQLITRWVGQALGPVPVSFFASDGDARRRFRRFGALAEAVVPDEEADVAVAAANAHFGLFREWLGGALPDRNG